jgi:hypothetical protein
MMFTPKTALFTFAATCALAMGACQPAEGPAEQAAKSADNTAERQLDGAGIAATSADKAATASLKDTPRANPQP